MPRRVSLYTVFALCALLIALRGAQTAKHALTWDVFGYYIYLPATVIHDDLALKKHAWLDEVMATYDPSTTLYQLVDGPDGARVIKYSSGMALAYAPWFLLAHGVAEPLGYPADGFSLPYQYIITYGMLAWVLLGLFLFRRALLHFFSEGWVAILLLLITLGTNWLHLAVLDGTLLTHPFLFTLYAALLLATAEWHRQPRWPAAIAIGAAAGWITLVRPSEGVCVLLPLLWAGRDGIRAKWGMVRAGWLQVVLAVCAFMVMASPQLLYWKSVTGHWLFYSYVNAGEGFDFAAPHIVDYLVSFRKGWLIYTPMALLMIGGLVALWKHQRGLFWPIALFLLMDLYVVSSWTNWWYAGGSFSARSMVPAYAVLALPLGSVLMGSWRRVLVPVSLLFLLLNLFQTWQWNHGIISKERMTAAYYAAIFGQVHIPDGAGRLQLVDRPLTEEEHLLDETAYTKRLLFLDTYDDHADGCHLLSDDAPYTPGPDVAFKELTGRDHAWLRVSARLLMDDGVPPVIVCTFHHKGEPYKYKTASWDTIGHSSGEWVLLSFDYITPEVRSPQDNVKVYIWNQHGGKHRVDDLRVEVFEPKGP